MTTYFLTSLESSRFEDVRECVFIRKMTFDSGKEAALVKLTPAVDGQSWGLAGDAEYFVLACRHEGEHLFPVSTFPCFVHIARLLNDNAQHQDCIKTADVQAVAWGELHRSYEDAVEHAFN